MLEKIFDIIKNNFKNPKLYIGILVVLLCFLVLFPYIDANLFYYQRINNRIDILQKISELDTEIIFSNEILANEYDSILSEIEKQSAGSLGSIFINEADEITSLIKFFSGASVFFVFAILCLFVKGFQNRGSRIFGLVFCVLLGVAFGFVAKAIPTIINPIVNYIGFPTTIIVIIALLATGGKKKEK